MNLWQAVLLGAVQGLTEFLPVSSSGHLRVIEYFAGLREPQTVFDVSLHVGTLLAVLLFFRRDVADIAWAPVRAVETLLAGGGMKGVCDDNGVRGLAFVIVGTIPTVLIALTLGRWLESGSRSMLFVGTMFLVNSAILLGSRLIRLPVGGDRLNTGFIGMRTGDAVAIGIMQGLAVARGISRSGSTISVALMLGVDRRTAGKYSFLLSVPAIAGAAVVSMSGFAPSDSIDTTTMFAAAAVALVTGAVSLKVVMSLLERGRIHRFGWYTLLLGIGLIVWEAGGLEGLLGVS